MKAVFGWAAAAFALMGVTGQACSTGVPTDACDRLFDAYVALLEKCGPPVGRVAPLNVLDTRVDDVFDARSQFDAHYCSVVPGMQGVSNMRAGIDSCTAALAGAAAGCDFSVIGAACALRGTLPWKSPCAYSEQCASGWCIPGGPPNPSTDLVCGTCARLRQAGEDCSTADDLCDTGSFCSHVLGSSVYTCTSYVPVGAACNYVDAQCDPASASCSGTCISIKGVAAPVQRLPLCGAMCRGGDVDGGWQPAPCTCGPSATCPNMLDSACEPKAKLGEPCVVGGRSCDVWLVCTNGVCSEPDATLCTGK
ncbi:MAG TPA: hypothetical protein VLM85_25370 [Polyangiaceae bacterium]|nr:hypothetical protein [Polyangiaceae bacterium]